MKKLKPVLLLLFFVPVVIVLRSQPTLPEDGEIYRDDVIPRIDIIISPDTLNWIYQNPDSDIEFHSIFVFDNGTIHDTVEDVGFRLRGNTSRYSAKKSFKISFNTYQSGRTYHGLEKMNLNGEHNDPCVARAKVCWDLLRSFDVPAPRSNHVRVFINQNFYGLYINVEHIDEEFAGSRFGNQDGNLFKCLWPADLKYLGQDPDLYKYESGGRRAYDLKTNTIADDYTDLAHFIDVLNNTPINDLDCELEKVFNVHDYLKMMALDVATANWDGYIFNKNNFYLYHNTESGLFEYIPYDLDNTYGIDWFGIDWAVRDIYNWSHDEYRPLYDRLMEVQKYRDWYSWYLEQVSETLMNPQIIFPEINQMRDFIYPYILQDPYYPMDYGYSPEDFLEAYESGLGAHVPYGLKEYITVRVNSMNAQLEVNNINPIVKYPDVQHQGIGNPVTFIIYAEDDQPGISVHLSYQVDQGNNEIAEMFDDGNHGDGEAGDKVFGVIIGPFMETTAIAYQFKAQDQHGHETIYPCVPSVVYISASAVTGLYINEFMADNATIIQDEAGDYDDWIEIYNGSDNAIWLGDKYLSDNLDNPSKWAFPDITIEPEGFLLVWADEDGDQGPLHTNFKLSKSGEEIGIFDNESTGFAPVDTYVFGEQTTDISEGRDPDGGEVWKFYQFPTPGVSNLQSSVDINNSNINSLQVSPNPVIGNWIYLSKKATGVICNAQGIKVIEFNESDKIEISGLTGGMYVVRIREGLVVKFVIL